VKDYTEKVGIEGEAKFYSLVPREERGWGKEILCWARVRLGLRFISI
jgi:hypothetical protein